MIKECYEILERYLHEWVSEGEKHLHSDMEMRDLARHILIGKALKKADAACHIAKKLAGEEAEHHELMAAYPHKTAMPAGIKPQA